jgi:hypothetical protein
MLRTHQEAEMVLDEALAAASKAAKVADKKIGKHDTCGDAFVSIRPARGKLITALKLRNIGKTLEGYGYVIWASALHDVHLTQSITVHERAARAFAEVVCKYGVNAHAEVRMD